MVRQVTWLAPLSGKPSWNISSHIHPTLSRGIIIYLCNTHLKGGLDENNYIRKLLDHHMVQCKHILSLARAELLNIFTKLLYKHKTLILHMRMNYCSNSVSTLQYKPSIMYMVVICVFLWFDPGFTHIGQDYSDGAKAIYNQNESKCYTTSSMLFGIFSICTLEINNWPWSTRMYLSNLK